MNYTFSFGAIKSKVSIQDELPSFEEAAAKRSCLFVCDTNTEFLARKILSGVGSLPEAASPKTRLCVLESGEAAKTWTSVEAILKASLDAGLDRTSLLIGIGGGVVSDLCAFAASIYMRGIQVCIISTTLLGMVDAALGGKTGFDFSGIKNLAGTFYPAEQVYMPLSSLDSLPEREWKSGLAELIKTAVLGDRDFFEVIKSLKDSRLNLKDAISRAVVFKGRVVEKDPKETGTERILLNLGHSFGHALESSLGLGEISHGEAVAWGMARSCELGQRLGVTPKDRAAEIIETLNAFGFEIKTPYPGMDTEKFMHALGTDKKNKKAGFTFIVPREEGARAITVDFGESKVIRSIIS